MNEPSPGQVPRKSSGLKAVVIVVIMAILIAFVFWQWRESQKTQTAWSSGPIDVVATTVKTTPAPVGIEALGELRAVHQVTLASEVAGRISAVSFKSGQDVKAGSVLIQLDDSVEQAELLAAKAAATFASQQFSRASTLAATGAVSREILQQRQAERDQSAAQVQQLEARIRQKRIRAPFDGKLGIRRIDLGQYINSGDPIVTLTALNQLYANFDIPQQELARIKVGQTAEVSIDTPGVEPLSGTITAIEPQIGRDTRNASIQVEIDNQDRAMQPGMYATVSVELPPELDAIMLPVSVVMTSAFGDTAAIVRDISPENTGKADIVPVVVGRRIGDRVIITSGLKAGDIVLTEGQLRVRPGADLKVVNQSVAPDAANVGGQP